MSVTNRVRILWQTRRSERIVDNSSLDRLGKSRRVIVRHEHAKLARAERA
jgi:hypothetical protein